MSAAKNAPHEITIEPRLSVAVCQAPLGMNGVRIGMMMKSTSDFTRPVAAKPIMKAIARGIILYSLRNSLNSFTSFITEKRNKGI